MKLNEYKYHEMMLNTAILEVPRATYQRGLCAERVRRIAKAFDERIANEPKVSYRDGHYYVFDGQHTIAAWILLNGSKHLIIKCKVYYGLTEQEEAILFAQQTGAAAKLSAGARMRALLFGGDAEAIAFRDATESVGLTLDYDQDRGLKRIGCIQTAFDAFKQLGVEKYKEAMQILVDAWDGEPNSLRSETVLGVTHFVALYHGEYDHHRLVNNLRRVDPLTIYREGRAMGVNLHGYKKYLYQFLRIYNISGKRNALPMKF